VIVGKNEVGATCRPGSDDQPPASALRRPPLASAQFENHLGDSTKGPRASPSIKKTSKWSEPRRDHERGGGASENFQILARSAEGRDGEAISQLRTYTVKRGVITGRSNGAVSTTQNYQAFAHFFVGSAPAWRSR